MYTKGIDFTIYICLTNKPQAEAFIKMSSRQEKLHSFYGIQTFHWWRISASKNLLILHLPCQRDITSSSCITWRYSSFTGHPTTGYFLQQHIPNKVFSSLYTTAILYFFIFVTLFIHFYLALLLVPIITYVTASLNSIVPSPASLFFPLKLIKHKQAASHITEKPQHAKSKVLRKPPLRCSKIMSIFHVHCILANRTGYFYNSVQGLFVLTDK